MTTLTTARGPTRHQRSVRWLVVCALAATACSADPAPVVPSGPYADLWADALTGATTDFEKAALADGEVSRDEYVEAHQLWLTRMEQEFPPNESPQVRIVEREDGLFEFTLSSVDEDDQARFDTWSSACAVGTTDWVAFLDNSITDNPNNLSFPAQLFDCLVDKGVVPDGYTVEDYEDDFFAYADGSKPSVPIPNDGPAVLECAATI